ncbi:MAG: hypothetical protein K9J27_03275 [Bacteroidales bacterium]|nr:hypothetical protein [Bacteroidales bacterium]MCF8332796.1 hypothetical protein [Bacteroidales bacterium]
MKIPGNSRSKGLLKIVAAAVLAVVFVGCSVDRRLAKEFVEETPKPPVVFKKPDKFYMVSYRETDKDTTGLKSWQVDSIRFYESKYLQHLDEEKLKDNFSQAFDKEMENLGFDVYQGKEVASLIGNDTVKPIIISFPQMEMNEYMELYRDRGYVGNQVYYKNMELNAIDLNTWLKLARHRTDQQKVFYMQDSITDYIDGYFYRDRKAGKVKYRYEEHILEKGDIYEFMKDMGRNYAQYVYDYYLNRFIDLNRDKAGQRRFLYHYDPVEQKFILINQMPWTEMETNSSDKF